MTYREWATGVPGATRWRSRGDTAASTTVLPDGCVDLLLLDDRLVVAGPDTVARVHPSPRDVVGVRLALGRGPRLLGIPAHELRDRTVDLADLWPARAARALTGRVVGDPVSALARWAGSAEDPWTARVFAAADAGLGAAEIADRAGVGARTLHRRCLVGFGYGPQHLVRVLRLQRALARRRAGGPWADVAADVGYADQPHLAREVRALTGRRPGELA